MATTTPNFSWSVPTSTDLVKDGALAIETLGDAIDGRFGDVGTYPNQIVNRVSGVSRPVPYAIAVGSGVGITGSGTITFPAGRFTVAPAITGSISSTNNTGTSVTFSNTSTTSVTAYLWSGTAASTTSRSVSWIAIQMTSTATNG